MRCLEDALPGVGFDPFLAGQGLGDGEGRNAGTRRHVSLSHGTVHILSA